MAHKFERCRIELLPDGTANIGITISDDQHPEYGSSAQWVICPESHTHSWSACEVKNLFAPSAKGILEAWMNGREAEFNRPKDVAIPTKKVMKDGKEVDEPDKVVNLQ